MAEHWRKYDDYNWQAYGEYVRKVRQNLHWTLDLLARKSGINNKGTLHQIEQGKRGLSPTQREQLIRVLIEVADPRNAQLNRREFMVLAGLTASTIIQVAVGHDTTHLTLPNVISAKDNDREHLYELIYDLGVGCTDTWDMLLFHGRAAVVLEQARHRYQLFTMAPVKESKDVSITAMRVGMRLARALEAVCDWYERSAAAIAVYNDVEARFILPCLERFPRDIEVMHEHARLLALRAPLFRELRQYQRSFHDFQKAIANAQYVDDFILLANLYLNRAHTIAALGDEDRWKSEYIDISRVIENAPKSERAILEALATYHQGEGKKRFAFNHRVALSERERIDRAEVGICALETSRKQLLPYWHDVVLASTPGGHPLITRVSEAQCRVWTSPEQALIELEVIKADAERDYPSLSSKIAFTISCATQRLRWIAHNPLPIFDLDLKYKQ